MAPAGLKGSKAKNVDVSKNNINILSLYKHEKNRHPTLKHFFIADYILLRVFRGFEQLFNSIWGWIVAWGEMHPRVAFEGAKFLSIFGLWAIVLCPDMLGSESMALKTRIRVKIPTKHWVQKMSHWFGDQGQKKMAKITQKHPYFWRSPQKSLNPKRKMFFFLSAVQDLLNP